MHVYILLDRSGSMEGLWNTSLNAINNYVKELPENAKVTLAVFDSPAFSNIYDQQPSYDEIRTRVKKNDFKPLTRNEVAPRGGTPLHDATAKIINQMIEDDCRKAILVVVTDGFENASKEHTQESVKAKIEVLKQNDWGIVFMGADFKDVEVVSQKLNVGSGNTVYVKPEKLDAFYKGLTTRTASYNLATSGQAAATMDWSDEDKKELSK